MNLKNLIERLKEDDMDAAFVPSTPDLPVEHVDVMFAIGGFNEKLVMQISLVDPDGSANVPDLQIVQIYVPIPVEIIEGARQGLQDVMITVNETVPMGALNIHEEQQFVYYRNVLFVPDDNEKTAITIIAEAIWLAYFTMDNLSYDLARIASGLMSPSGFFKKDD